MTPEEIEELIPVQPVELDVWGGRFADVMAVGQSVASGELVAIPMVAIEDADEAAKAAAEAAMKADEATKKINQLYADAKKAVEDAAEAVEKANEANEKAKQTQKTVEGLIEQEQTLKRNVEKAIGDAEEATSNANTAAAKCETLNQNPPKIGHNGHWWTYDTLHNEYVDTGVGASMALATFSLSEGNLVMNI